MILDKNNLSEQAQDLISGLTENVPEQAQNIFERLKNFFGR